MQFDEFVRLVDSAVRDTTTVERHEPQGDGKAAWVLRSRTASVALVPPLNVSVALEGGAQPAQTTWYPIDAALVPVVSRRIAGFLSES
ncbi:MAG TPA: hypothetical protein VE826_08905 [Dongiaceae bacterium]|nr:hypothetical protein [Dongiaceae bacterium]